MRTRHLEFLVEEPSMEAFLRVFLPRLLPKEQTFVIHTSRNKAKLRQNLGARLRAYARWLPDDWRIVVVLDRDSDDCHTLKAELEAAATSAGLRTRSRTGCRDWQVVTRIAIEELEAWYFGDWEAVCDAYPGVPRTVPQREGFRDPDGIRGGTWESFERILKRSGRFTTGLRKVEAARQVAARILWQRNRSRSFTVFVSAVLDAGA